MAKARLVTPLYLALTFPGAAQPAEVCPTLKAPAPAGLPNGQYATTTTGPMAQVPPSTHHLPVPEGPLETVHVTLERTECYGICPSYTIDLKGDGSATYNGKAFVLVHGRHTFEISKTTVQCLLDQFKRADFWSLADEYTADLTDGPLYRLTLSVGGQTKTVSDYFGQNVGMPTTVTALEDEIDRLGADRWVHGDGDTLAALRRENFDFHSPAAGTILIWAAAHAPDDLVLGLIAVGAPATNQPYEPGHRDGGSAIVNASRAGRVAIVEALIAKGALVGDLARIKDQALIAAAASGNPLVVADILKERPNVAAKDRESKTALNSIWQSQGYGRDRSQTDVVAVARLLLQAGSDPNVPDNTGSTALFSASNAEVVELLVKAGGRVDWRNKYGSTPLLFADSDSAALALLEAGADTTATNRFGDTIEKEAVARKFEKTLRLLRLKHQSR